LSGDRSLLTALADGSLFILRPPVAAAVDQDLFGFKAVGQ
jgi:hypothetical protein